MVESHRESGSGRAGAHRRSRQRRPRRDASQWRALVEQQRVSGQSVKAFCAEHDLGEASFYAWRRHLRQSADPAGGGSSQASASPPPTDAKESASTSAVAMTTGRPQATDDGRPNSNATGFVRLDPRADASSDAIEVRFPCGTTLRCSSSHLPELVRLLKVEADEAGRC